MFVEQIPSGEKVLRTVLVYALVAVLVRLSGKRGLAGLNTLDIVVMTLLSNVVQNAIIGDDLSVTGGALGAATLVLVNALANRLTLVSPAFQRLFDGTDTKLVVDGDLQTRDLRRAGLSRASLEHAVRMQNGEDLSQVDDATLAPDGQLLVTLRAAEQSATKADVDTLGTRLSAIEAALTELAARSAGR